MEIDTVSGGFMSVLQSIIPKVITSHKCQMNICPIVNSYNAMDRN
jgi:amino acid permease